MRIQNKARREVSSEHTSASQTGHKQGHFSTKRISQALIEEITSALHKVDAYGSIEIYIQNATVTQITTRSIKKTNGLR